jgi:hypothetical protein
MTHNTAQPADTEGEWRQAVSPRWIFDSANRHVATADTPERAAQIISDHKAAKSQALLVEALHGT